MNEDRAECAQLEKYLQALGARLDQFLEFTHPDAMADPEVWQAALDKTLPAEGVGAQAVLDELQRWVIPNGSSIPKPGSTSYITTGAVTVAALANIAGNIASPQRATLTAFHYLEELSLDWLARMFELPLSMKGVYSSGGSVANLIALGAARQYAFEKLGLDVSEQGVDRPVRLYVSTAAHRTLHRSAAVLGIGREAVFSIACDAQDRLLPERLQDQINRDMQEGFVPLAIVANAGTTSTGSIDALQAIGEIAHQHGIWYHIDGAYGLPGILDPQVKALYQGLELADSVIVDPHKWLGAPVGIGATFVRDRNILFRAFNQGESDYLEGSLSDEAAQHSMDSLGIPFFDFGVELSAPARGVVVWALLREIGLEGMRERICRHNAMARWLADKVREHQALELLQEPTLSICCFRYVPQTLKGQREALNQFNRRLHRQLVHNNINIPSTAMVGQNFAIRPCFIGARTGWKEAEGLLQEVLEQGEQLEKAGQSD